MTRAASDSPPEPGRLTPLRSSRRFEAVLSSGRRRRSGGIIVVSLPSSGAPAQVGLVVTRRTGPAVVRNRIKRRLRAALRAARLPTGGEHVVIAQRSAATVPFDKLVEWIETGFEHAD